MKSIVTIWVMMTIPCLLMAQNVEVFTGQTRAAAGTEKKVDLFSKGLIDYGFSGQVQASAQAVKINIGEPQGFYVPIYLLVGATNGDIGSEKLNKSTVLSMINSTGGLLNLSTNFYVKLLESNSGITNLRFTSQLGGKLVTGRDSLSSDGKATPMGFLEAGLFFQTGAWEADAGYEEGGIFWLQARYAIMSMAKDDLKSYFGEAVNQLPAGPKIEMGILIKNKVNIKLSYFKAVSGERIPTLNDGQFRLALDYSVFK